jgi:hypothetical protein
MAMRVSIVRYARRIESSSADHRRAHGVFAALDSGERAD